MTKAIKYIPASFPLSFTRNSEATYFNENGVLQTALEKEARRNYDPDTLALEGFLVEKAGENLVDFTEDFTEWGRTRLKADKGYLSPDGTSNATLLKWDGDLNPSSHPDPILIRTTPLNSSLGGLEVTFSIWVKFPATNVTDEIQFFVIGSEVSSSPVLAVPKDGEWHRVVETITVDQNETSLKPNIRFDLGGNDTALGDEFYIWGAQVEVSSEATSYIPKKAEFISRSSIATYFDSNGVLQTASIDEPRFGHRFDGSSWISQDLIIEDSVTNLVTDSEDYTQASWSKSDIGVSSVIAGGPLGEYREVSVSLGDGGLLRLKDPIPFDASTRYVVSCFAKQAVHNEMAIFFDPIDLGGANAFPQMFVDLATGTVTGFNDPSNLIESFAVEPYGDGWYRVSITCTNDQATTGGVTIIPRIPDINNTTPSDVGKSIYLTGVQVEKNYFPTSYIKTTGSTVTRSADVVESMQKSREADKIIINDLTPWFNEVEGSFVVDVEDASNLRLISEVLPTELISGSGSFVITYNSTGSTLYTSTETISLDAIIVNDLLTFAELGSGKVKGVRYYPRTLTNTEISNNLSGTITRDFYLLSMFEDGSEGVWYDPSDLTTLYQDSFGTTRVTSDGDLVGLMLDKSKGLIRGPEILLNGTFDTDVLNWTPLGPATTSWQSGAMAVDVSASAIGAYQDISITSGKTYEVLAEVVSSDTSATIEIWEGGSFTTQLYSHPSVFGSGKIKFLITPSVGSIRVYARTLSSGSNFVVDNISVKELPGNHAAQPTSASRPVYRTDGTLSWLEFDGVDDYLSIPVSLDLNTGPFSIASTQLSEELGDMTIVSFGTNGTGKRWKITPEYGIRVVGGNEIYDTAASLTNTEVIVSSHPGGDVGNSTFYLNGVELASQTVNTQIVDVDPGGSIGAEQEGTNNTDTNNYGMVVLVGSEFTEDQRNRVVEILAEKSGVTL